MCCLVQALFCNEIAKELAIEPSTEKYNTDVLVKREIAYFNYNAYLLCHYVKTGLEKVRQEKSAYPDKRNEKFTFCCWDFPYSKRIK